MKSIKSKSIMGKNPCDMNDKEFKIYLSDIRKFNKKLKKDPELAKEFLISAGIMTKKGNLRKPYR